MNAKLTNDVVAILMMTAAQKMAQKVLNQFDRTTESQASQLWIALDEKKAVIMMGF